MLNIKSTAKLLYMKLYGQYKAQISFAKKFIVATSAITLIFSGANAFAYDVVNEVVAHDYESEDKVYLIGTEGSFPPFSYFEDNEHKNLSGIDIELFDEIAKLYGFKYKYVRMRFADLFTSLNRRKLDGIIDGVSYTPERGMLFEFSDPYFVSGTSVISNDYKNIRSFNDLYGAVAATKTGTLGEYLVYQLQDKYGFHVQRFNTTLEIFLAVATGAADFLLEEYPSAAYNLSSGLYTDLEIAIPNVSDPLYTDLHFITKKGYNPKLMQYFNEGLKVLIANGKYHEIVRKHLGNLYNEDHLPKGSVPLLHSFEYAPELYLLQKINNTIEKYKYN